MLFLLFHLGDDPCVLEVGRIGEVLPLVRVKAAPGAARRGLGVISHRGAPMPVVDLSELVLGRPTRQQLSTRIVLVHAAEAEEAPSWLGIVLEQATETLRLDPARFATPRFRNAAAPYLGRVLAHERGLIHWIDPAKLLACVRGALPVPEPAGQA